MSAQTVQTIEITFPLEIPPRTVTYILEGNMKTNTIYRCKVSYQGVEDGENVFYVSSNCASAFYYIGMTASGIIEALNAGKFK